VQVRGEAAAVTTDRWQFMPPLSDEEFAALKRDIAGHGVIVPVVIDAATGETVDGHHRQRAVEELKAEGIKVDYQRDVRRFTSDDERMAFVVGANLFRRHLNREQRTEIESRLRELGWSLRRIGEVVGVDHTTVRDDLRGVGNPTREETPIVGRDGKTYRARRPQAPSSIVVGSSRDETRARAAFQALGDDAPPKLLSLSRAESQARDARIASLRSTTMAPKIEGPDFELRLGDLREVWSDVPDGSIDCIVTDPPYDNEGVPLFEDLARLALRVLRPGRLAAIYCGHMYLDTEMELLAKGGLTYVWPGVNVLSGRHTNIHSHLINGHHRSVLLFSAGKYQPRGWIHDTYLAEGQGGPESRPLHPWQQAVEPLRHWIRSISKLGEVVFDPFVGSGTTAVAAVTEGRRFLGGDIDPAYVETTRRRLVELAESNTGTLPANQQREEIP